MQVFVKPNGTATVQLNRDAMYYVGHFAREGKLALKGVELGDFLSCGFGWYRIVSDKINTAVLLIQTCIRKYRKARDAECRAQLAIAAGAKVIAVSHTNAPFQVYTLEMQTIPRPKPVRRIAEASARVALNGMRATSAQLGALVTKFAKG